MSSPQTSALTFASDMQEAAWKYGPYPQLLSGGFGCIGAETRIYDNVAGSHIPVWAMVVFNYAPRVLAWAGDGYVEVTASVPFVKGVEHVYRVTVASGKSIEVTKRHRFLTEQGWRSLADLGDDYRSVRLRVSDVALPPSISGSDPATSRRDVTRSWCRGEDSPIDYLLERRLRDARLRRAEDSDQSQLPSRDDVLGRIRSSSHEDGWVGGPVHSRVCLGYDRLSTQCCERRVEHHVSSLEDYARGEIGESVQVELSSRELDEFQRNRDQLQQAGGFGVGTLPRMIEVSYLDHIISVEDLGPQVFYDLHVPGYENYLAEGFINHNSGKTWLGCMKALWLSDVFPKNRGAIIRQVGKQLRKTTMATFRKLCPPSAYEQGGRWNEQEGSLILNNKSEIIWLQLDDPASLQIIKGLEINWFFIDQAEENPEGMESIYDTLLSRLGRWDQVVVPQWLLQREYQAGREWRWKHPVTLKPVPPQYAMLACNPDSELHWLYRRFHPESPEWRDKYQVKGYKMFHMPSTDNKFLTDQNKANLLDQDESFVRRYVRGEWGFPEGAIHDINKASRIEFDDPTDAERFLDWIRNNCGLYRFLDHGDSAPTVCGWAAQDKNGNIFFYREYYQPNKLISYHREAIGALSDGEIYIGNYADPAIFNQTMQKTVAGKMVRSSVADEYRSSEIGAPVLHWLPADNNELGTRNKISEYLRLDPKGIHAMTKTQGAPRLYFVMRTPAYTQGCFFLSKETGAQRRVQIGTIEGRPVFSDERDPGIVDHGYDVVRYAIAHFGQTKKHTPQHKRVTGLTYERASQLLKMADRKMRIRR